MAKIRAKLETLKVAATSYTLKLPEYQEGDLLIAWLVRGSSSGTLT